MVVFPSRRGISRPYFHPIVTRAALTLARGHWDRAYIVTTNNGTELLLDESQYERYKATGELHNPMRRAH